MLADRFVRAILGLIALALVANLVLGLRGPATADEPQPVAPAVGRYQVAAPDLITDTTTGSTKNAKGEVIVPALSAEPRPIGTYQSTGWVTIRTRVATWDALGRPQIVSEEQRGVATVDTRSGKIVVSRIYWRGPARAISASLPPSAPAVSPGS